MPAPVPPAPLWRRLPPFAWALAVGLLCLVAAFVPTLWHLQGRAPGPAPGQGLEPWQVRPGPGGTSSALGLQLGTDTLGSLQARLGDALQPAVLARRGEPGALEALVDPFSAGFVAGRLVLAFDAPPEAVARWRDDAARSDVTDSGARRFTLSAAGAREAASAPLAGATFVPALALRADDVTRRFGAPASVLRGADGLETWLYPPLGLAIALQPGRKAVLQYVAPAEFERRLAAPLARGAAAGG